jgi:hypothetical protein
MASFNCSYSLYCPPKIVAHITIKRAMILGTDWYFLGTHITEDILWFIFKFTLLKSDWLFMITIMVTGKCVSSLLYMFKIIPFFFCQFEAMSR